MDKKEFTCPICKGCGVIEIPHVYKIKKAINKKIMAKLLRKEGYSMRQIQVFLDYKSPRSIHKIIHE